MKKKQKLCNHTCSLWIKSPTSLSCGECGLTIARSAEQEKIVPFENIGKTDPVNHPKHYTSHPSGIECITVTEHMGFNLGNAVKYVWRADLKNDAIEDLKKAVWYIQREIAKREKK
jgi:hypothetical protein